jgi:hypothetical protein
MMIGNPTIGGWLTVTLYFLAALSCWITARELGSEHLGCAKELRAWRYISALFLALGVYKQLDLLVALTEAGRAFVYSQGWYDQRRPVQAAFIVLVAIACAVTVVTLLVWARKTPAPTWLGLTGATMTLGFVLIRAASFHHIDRILRERILSLRWDWLLEMGGISVVLLASFWRPLRVDKSRRPSTGGARDLEPSVAGSGIS